MVVAASRALNMAVPIGNLTMSMIRVSGKPPKLKLKAAESRHMLVILTYILENFLPPQDAHEELVLQCVRALNDCYKIMDPTSWALDPVRSSQKLQRTIRHYLLLLQATSRHDKWEASTCQARCRSPAVELRMDLQNAIIF